MILSASRRTDIPTYYSDWFFNRIKEGFLYVRNPMNIHQVSKINLSPDVVDCIVFWTKNPKPMLKRLDELKNYMYYFQFTLTGYGKDLEANIPFKKDVILPSFKELSDKIGKERVIWRYDPIVFNQKYTPECHLKTFEKIAAELDGYTEKCVISFVDIYVKNKGNMNSVNAYEISQEELEAFAKRLADIAHSHNMKIASCAEIIDLEKCGIEHNQCIDKDLIEKLLGCEMKVSKDKIQRAECGCMESVEIGTYNTCLNGCKYCYANYSMESVAANNSLYDPNSPFLCSQPISGSDKISERKVKSLKGNPFDAPKQMSLFDYLGE